MTRIACRLSAVRAAGRSALIPYITAGDPQPDATVDIMHTLVAAGADAIELGVPFSDPMADGPTIQAACERALVHGTGLRDVLAMVRRFRETNTDTPIVLMGYLNPIDRMGIETFAEQAQAAGVDGVLVVDLSTDEAPEVLPTLRAWQLDPICLMAPTTSDERMAEIGANSSGYVYYVSFKGVTGSNGIDVDALAGQLKRVRARTDVPVAVGFGVRTPQIAAAVARLADGVIVGSALVSEIGRLADDREQMLTSVSETLGAMRGAMDASSNTGVIDA